MIVTIRSFFFFCFLTDSSRFDEDDNGGLIISLISRLLDTRNDESDDSGVYDYTGKPDKLLYRHIAETPLKASILGNSWLPIFE